MGEQADYLAALFPGDELYWGEYVPAWQDPEPPPQRIIHYRLKKGIRYMEFHQELIEARMKWRIGKGSKVPNMLSNGTMGQELLDASWE